LPECLDENEITESQSNNIIYNGLSDLFDSKNASQSKQDIEDINNNVELTEEQKNQQIKEIAYSKHINLIDPIEFNKYKKEIIENSYDEILNNDLLNDEEKLTYIDHYVDQLDNFFLNLNDKDMLTNDSLSLYTQHYLENNVDFTQLTNEQQDQLFSNQDESCYSIFANQNRITLKNSNLFYEDIFENSSNIFTNDFSYQNSELLSQYFVFTDYFDNITLNLEDLINDKYQI
jgi:hypothetical protein